MSGFHVKSKYLNYMFKVQNQFLMMNKSTPLDHSMELLRGYFKFYEIFNVVLHPISEVLQYKEGGGGILMHTSLTIW